MANGYMGKILWVNLSEGRIWSEDLDEQLCRQVVGGYGLGSSILLRRMKAQVDPLGPQNLLGFLTGPLTGTPTPGGSRYTVVAKSPISGTWGDANSGGYFGPHLKFAGYDGVFFSGRSDSPVYLFIENGRAELRDASSLWGQETGQVEDSLQAKHGGDVRVASIGPAGEKLSLISAIMNDRGRAAGRSGLGAVMGSKYLKAIAVKGQNKVPLFDEKASVELKTKTVQQLSALVETMRNFGTCAMLVGAVKSDDAPVKNWAGTAGEFADVEAIGGNNVIDRQQRRYACFNCPVGCGGLMKAGKGEYLYPEGAHKPEYETLSMFGSNCLNSNLESIIKLNDLCNCYGLDTISTGATLAFAMECYQNGLITKQDADGLDLTWGNHRAMVKLVEKIGRREGLGDVLADGVRVAAAKIGRGAEELAMHLQGQEYPAHDPHYRLKWAIAYRMDATPVRHTQGGGMLPPGLTIPDFDPQTLKGGGRAQKTVACFNHLVNSAGLCQITMGTYPTIGRVVEVINAVTGWGATIDDLLLAGERIANLRQAFNLREGLNPLKYQVPARIAARSPKKSGPMAGVKLKEEPVDREFCEAMDWDVETTRPSHKKLLELGLKDVARELGYP